MNSDVPVKLLPEKTFDQIPNPYLVLVPDGGLGTIRAMGNQALREYLVAAAETAHTVASVCTGALILGAADLLQGRNATTHWAYATFLERLGAGTCRSGESRTASSFVQPGCRPGSTWPCI